jgi:hypothetical protein
MPDLIIIVARAQFIPDAIFGNGRAQARPSRHSAPRGRIAWPVLLGHYLTDIVDFG